MEDDLDRIARGEAQSVPWLKRFYFGSEDATEVVLTNGDHLGGLKELVTDLGAIDAREISSFPVGDGVVLRVGRYGPYVERGEKDAEGHQRADVPDDLAPDELTVEYAEELFAKPSGEFELGKDPVSGNEIVAKDGRYGPYVTEILPEGTPKTGKNAVKPRTASLFKSMTLDTVTLDEALKLMSLPRVVGADAEGVEITAQNGRYGPYLKKGTDSRSLETEDQLFSITLDEALAIYAQPKQRGRAAAKPPLKELGTDPVSEKPVVVKDGRFGPYVTDGETNATLRRDDDVETITPERGYELLAEKRAKGPAKKTAKKAAGEEGPGQEGDGDEGGGREEDDHRQEGRREEDGRQDGDGEDRDGEDRDGEDGGGEEDRGRLGLGCLGRRGRVASGPPPPECCPRGPCDPHGPRGVPRDPAAARPVRRCSRRRSEGGRGSHPRLSTGLRTCQAQRIGWADDASRAANGRDRRREPHLRRSPSRGLPRASGARPAAHTQTPCGCGAPSW